MNDRNRHKRFKYVYKSIALLVAFLVGIVACTSYYVSNTEEEKTQKPSQEQLSSTEVNTPEEAPEAPTEETEQSKEEIKSVDFTIGSGKYTVGDDVTAGKYNVSTPNDMGNLIINGDLTYVNEILGTSEDWAVNNVRVELFEGDVIEISGLQQVDFQVVD